jgi:hypothetical protein
MAGKEKPRRGSKGLQGVATMSLEAPALLNVVRVSTFQPYGCQRPLSPTNHRWGNLQDQYPGEYI